MKGLKKFVALVVAVGTLGLAGVAFAATLKTPAEISSELTGKTIAEVTQERSSGKTYGQIANEAGKLDEFKAQVLGQKKAVLDQRVAEGRLTQEQADEIYNNIKNNQAACDGTGSSGVGRKHCAGFVQGNCTGGGMMAGKRTGMGVGNGTVGGAGFGRALNR